MFYRWLCLQIHRQDRIGAFARYACKDKVFPRTANRLHLFLSRYQGMPEQRNGVKLAHAEFRKMKMKVGAP